MKDTKFKYFQEKIIEHLNNLEKKEEQDKRELRKAIIDYEKINKAGYPVGTVREWKGKKYIKIAPKRWLPKYDSESRGAKLSISALKKKALSCKSSQELLQMMLENKSRFSDENGYPIPIAKELSEYVSKLNDELESRLEAQVSEEKLKKIKDKLNNQLEQNAVKMPNIEFTEENYKKLIADGNIKTPIGYVKIGEHQFQKLKTKGREYLLGAVVETLENPIAIINANDGTTQYVKSFLDGDNIKRVVSVVIEKDGLNISISTHIKKQNDIENKINNAEDVQFFDKEQRSTNADNQQGEEAATSTSSTITNAGRLETGNRSVASSSIPQNNPDVKKKNIFLLRGSNRSIDDLYKAYKRQKQISNWDLEKEKKKLVSEYDFSGSSEKSKNDFLKPKFDDLTDIFEAAKPNIIYLKEKILSAKQHMRWRAWNQLEKKLKTAGFYDEIFDAEKLQNILLEYKNNLSDEEKSFVKQKKKTCERKYKEVESKTTGVRYNGYFYEGKRTNKQDLPKEEFIATVLASRGFNVYLIDEPRSGGKKVDAIVDDVPVDFKFIEDSKNGIRNGFNNAMQKQFSKGVIIRKPTNLTNSDFGQGIKEDSKLQYTGILSVFVEKDDAFQTIDIKNKPSKKTADVGGGKDNTLASNAKENISLPQLNTIPQSDKKSSGFVNKSWCYFDMTGRFWIKKSVIKDFFRLNK